MKGKKLVILTSSSIVDFPRFILARLLPPVVMKYIQLLASACNSANDSKLSAILKVSADVGRASNATAPSSTLYMDEFKALSFGSIESLRHALAQMLNDQSWHPFCVSYLQAKHAYLNLGDHKKAFQHVSEAYLLFLKLFETPNETFWLKNTLRVLCVNLRVLGKECDKRHSRKETTYMTVEGLLKKGFQATVASRSKEKKEAGIGVVNNMFKVYFCNNAVGSCAKTLKSFKIVFRSIDFDTLPLAQRITYRFYEGRLAIFQEDYVLAETCLNFCLEKCPKSEKSNRARILQYLIPVRMYFGEYPSAKLLRKYELHQYVGVLSALARGDVRRFDDHVKMNQSFFLSRGIYLLVEKLKTTLNRNLIFKIYNVLGKSNKIDLKAILPTLRKVGSVENMDGLECVITNLIYSGYIKGYISHAKFYLVLSKLNPCPDLADVGAIKRKRERRG